MKEFILLLGFAAIFAVSFLLLNYFYTGRKMKLYKKALERRSITEAHRVKSWYIRNADSNNKYDKNTQCAVYEYVIRGKSYKKKLMFKSNEPYAKSSPYIKFYYDEKNPRRVVTEDDAKTSRIATVIIVSFIIMIVVGNVLYRLTRLI